MSTAASLQHNDDDLGTVTRWVEQLERKFAAHHGGGRENAWKRIAEEDQRLSVGAIEGIARGRVKDVSTRVFRAVEAVLVRELTNEIKRLQSELEIARSAGLRVDPGSLSQAEAALTDARQALHTTH